MSWFYRVVIIIIMAVHSLTGVEIAGAEFPEKPIQVLVGWPVGSQNDGMDRVIAQSLQKILKQPVIIQNVPGVAGTLVLGRIKTEKPDGYTLFQTGTAMYFQSPHMRVVNYNPFTDFAYLAQHARFQNLIEDRPDSPWKNFDELILYAKKNPKKVKYGSIGIGGTLHIMMEYLAERENLQWINVPYNSVTEVGSALLGGHVDLIVTTFGLEMELIRAGRIRPLLCLDDKRMSLFPEIPTILEKGYDMTCFTSACWSVPVNTPKDIQQILETALLQSFKDPAVIEVINKWNMVYDPLDGETVAQLIAKNYKIYGEILKKLGIGIYKK